MLVTDMVRGQGFTTVAVTTSPKTVSAIANLIFLTQTTTTVGNLASGDTFTFYVPGG